MKDEGSVVRYGEDDDVDTDAGDEDDEVREDAEEDEEAEEVCANTAHTLSSNRAPQAVSEA